MRRTHMNTRWGKGNSGTVREVERCLQLGVIDVVLMPRCRSPLACHQLHFAEHGGHADYSLPGEADGDIESSDNTVRSCIPSQAPDRLGVQGRRPIYHLSSHGSECCLPDTCLGSTTNSESTSEHGGEVFEVLELLIRRSQVFIRLGWP